MADIDDLEAIAFTAQIRLAADQMAALYRTAKMINLTWHARNYGARIPVDAEAIVMDNRTPKMSGNDVVGIIVQLEQFVDDMEGNGKGKLNVVLKASPNP
jgi:CheY-like chemotaxis protein